MSPQTGQAHNNTHLTDDFPGGAVEFDGHPGFKVIRRHLSGANKQGQSPGIHLNGIMEILDCQFNVRMHVKHHQMAKTIAERAVIYLLPCAWLTGDQPRSEATLPHCAYL